MVLISMHTSGYNCLTQMSICASNNVSIITTTGCDGFSNCTESDAFMSWSPLSHAPMTPTPYKEITALGLEGSMYMYEVRTRCALYSLSHAIHFASAWTLK